MPARPGAADATRATILEAVAALLVEEHPATVSVPDVARRAGVSVRTVYRHFPTKADLVDAAARRHLRAVRPWEHADPAADVAAYLRPMWRRFADDVEAVRAEHVSAAGRSLRARRLPAARAQVGAAVADQLGHLDAREQAAVTDLIVTVTGSAMFLELVDRLGHDVDDAVDLATWLARAITAQGAVSPPPTAVSPPPTAVSPPPTAAPTVTNPGVRR